MDGQGAGGDHPEATSHNSSYTKLFKGACVEAMWTAGVCCWSPVLVELDGEVRHVLQGLVGEGHVHVHVSLAPRERPADLQTLGFDGWEPHLAHDISLTFSRRFQPKRLTMSTFVRRR